MQDVLLDGERLLPRALDRRVGGQAVQQKDEVASRRAHQRADGIVADELRLVMGWLARVVEGGFEDDIPLYGAAQASCQAIDAVGRGDIIAGLTLERGTLQRAGKQVRKGD